jgi:hypothetical protein
MVAEVCDLNKSIEINCEIKWIFNKLTKNFIVKKRIIKKRNKRSKQSNQRIFEQSLSKENWWVGKWNCFIEKINSSTSIITLNRLKTSGAQLQLSAGINNTTKK